MDDKSTRSFPSEESSVRTRKGVKRLLWDYCESSTAHGLSRVAASRSSTRKLFWTTVVVLVFSITIIQVTMLFAQYFQYPSEQISNVKHVSIEFPAVTICNVKAMSTSAKYELLKHPDTRFYQYTKYLKQIKNEIPKNETHIYENMIKPSGFYDNIGMGEVIMVGHTAENMIMGCRFNSQPCAYFNFTYHVDSRFFNCYTFNGKPDPDNPLVSREVGPGAGLSVELYVEADVDDILNGTYYRASNVANGAGARVVVHAPGTLPDPFSEGMDVPPGYSSSIRVLVEHFQRLGTPWGHCHNGALKGIVNPQSGISEQGYQYTVQACMSLCQQKYIMKECNCMYSALANPSSGQLQYCGDSSDRTLDNTINRMECVEQKLQAFSNNDTLHKECKCFSPCIETKYVTDQSMSYWPMEYYQANFFKKYVLDNPDPTLKAKVNLAKYNTSELVHEGYIRRNFLRLNVFLEELTVEEHNTQKAYQIQNLFSDIGGSLGLWIGMSVITIIEMLELGLTILVKFMKRKMATKRKVSLRGIDDDVSMQEKYSRRNSEIGIDNEAIDNRPEFVHGL